MEDLHIYVPEENYGSRFSKDSLLYQDIYNLLLFDNIRNKKNFKLKDICLEGLTLISFKIRLEELIELKLKNRTSCTFNNYSFEFLDKKIDLNPNLKLDHFHVIVLHRLWESVITAINSNNQIYFYTVPLNIKGGETLTSLINQYDQGISKNMLLQIFNNKITELHSLNYMLDTQQMELNELELSLNALLDYNMIRKEVKTETLFFSTQKGKNIFIL